MSDAVATNTSRSVWLGRGIALTILVLACLGAYWVGSRPRQVAAAQQSLVVSESALHFGEVWEDKAFVWTLPIENRSSQDIQILDLTGS